MDNKTNDGQKYIPVLLDMKTVLTIARRLEKGETVTALAKEYKVHVPTISRIKRQYTSLPLKPLTHYDNAFRDKALGAFKESGDVKGTAEKLGVNISTLRTWIRKAGIALDKPRKQYTDEFKEHVTNEYILGKKASELAKEHGIAEGMIYYWLKNAGISTDKGRGHDPKNKVNKEKGLEMYRNGIPVSKIAAELGYCEATVYRWASEEGISGNRTAHHLTEKEAARVRDLWEKGYPVVDICNITGLEYGQVTNFTKSL